MLAPAGRLPGSGTVRKYMCLDELPSPWYFVIGSKPTGQSPAQPLKRAIENARAVLLQVSRHEGLLCPLMPHGSCPRQEPRL